MKDWAKRFYAIDKNFPVASVTPSSKEGWNEILESTPELGEFTGPATQETIDLNRDGLIQSEFEKPYDATSYPEMEYSAEGDPGQPPFYFGPLPVPEGGGLSPNSPTLPSGPTGPTGGGGGVFRPYCRAIGQACPGQMNKFKFKFSSECTNLVFTAPSITPDYVLEPIPGKNFKEAYVFFPDVPPGTLFKFRATLVGSGPVDSDLYETLSPKDYKCPSLFGEFRIEIDGVTKCTVWDYTREKIAEQVPNGLGGFVVFPCLVSELTYWRSLVVSENSKDLHRSVYDAPVLGPSTTEQGLQRMPTPFPTPTLLHGAMEAQTGSPPRVHASDTLPYTVPHYSGRPSYTLTPSVVWGDATWGRTVYDFTRDLYVSSISGTRWKLGTAQESYRNYIYRGTFPDPEFFNRFLNSSDPDYVALAAAGASPNTLFTSDSGSTVGGGIGYETVIKKSVFPLQGSSIRKWGYDYDQGSFNMSAAVEGEVQHASFFQDVNTPGFTFIQYCQRSNFGDYLVHKRSYVIEGSVGLTSWFGAVGSNSEGFCMCDADPYQPQTGAGIFYGTFISKQNEPKLLGMSTRPLTSDAFCFFAKCDIVEEEWDYAKTPWSGPATDPVFNTDSFGYFVTPTVAIYGDPQDTHLFNGSNRFYDWSVTWLPPVRWSVTDRDLCTRHDHAQIGITTYTGSTYKNILSTKRYHKIFISTKGDDFGLLSYAYGNIQVNADLNSLTRNADIETSLLSAISSYGTQNKSITLNYVMYRGVYRGN